MRRLLLIPLLGLAACVDKPGNYPSLLPRAAEHAADDAPQPVQPATEIAADTALDTQIATLSHQLDEAAARFDAAASKAEARIANARGTPRGSDRWLAAQTALADVDAARAPVESALAELEQLAIARGTAGQPGYPALDSAIAAAQTRAEAVEQRSTTLEDALAG